eukprot:TRINITY_DN7657_c2_g1_i1.p3 TRINITY_DN7657_c2_g1~~TRINITY_DN7657_c2_g1_i1.p3  ORF type:complete len:105 (+),score=10.14 TRINITY_DN7657_c2_g1_i1:58-372(+)
MAESKKIIVYMTSSPTTRKVEQDLFRLRTILKAKGREFEEIDLLSDPSQRQVMTAASNGKRTLPQLHFGGKYVGDVDTIQEFEDFQEFDKILNGEMEPPPPPSQ